MNKQLVVMKLTEEVRFLRKCGSCDQAIRTQLIEQGWAHGAVVEALQGGYSLDGALTGRADI